MMDASHRFVGQHQDVLVHHMDCILGSRMILDEDMQVLTTFWNPNLLAQKPRWNQLAVTFTVCTSIGLVASAKLRSPYPVAAMLVPTALQACRYTANWYEERAWKRNFERLMSRIHETYTLSLAIMEYHHMRDLQMGKLSGEILDVLRPGEALLQRTVEIVVEILEKLRAVMFEICLLVPVTREYVHSLDWDLAGHDVQDLRHQLQRLTDLYVLIVSNFLSMLGLSFCVQLGKGASGLRHIFTRVIPSLCVFLEASVGEILLLFDRARFTLEDQSERRKNQKLPGDAVGLRLQQPLDDVLAHIQIAFDMAKELRVLLKGDAEPRLLENAAMLIDGVGDQLVACDDSLHAFHKLFAALMKRPLVQKAGPSAPALLDQDNGKISVEIHFDDPMESREDEEYNLSIHGSDEDDFGVPPLDYADELSVEHLELMLFELKRKLQERKGGRKVDDGGGSGENHLETAQVDAVAIESAKPSGPPPLPPALPPVAFERDFIEMDGPAGSSPRPLPPVDNSPEGFLDAVRSVAMKLNRDEEFQFGFNMFPEIPRPFNTTYRVFSVAMLPGNERQDVERGGKIIMPPSALEQLTRLNINYPMLFKIMNKKTSRVTHCGVLEFVADEGKVYLPLWMMHNLVLEEGDLLQIESISLPVGTFAKFQPLSPEFLDITNPKAVLENCLRTFACLTSGDVIAVKYNQRVYELCVLETQPGNAISIIECDMNVEFAPPVGYKEYEQVKHTEEDMVVDPADLMPEPLGFVAFRGAGNRLDGKRRKDSGSLESSSSKPVYVKGIPDYDYEIGTLKFLRHITKSPVDNKEEESEFKAFSGEGFSLKRRI